MIAIKDSNELASQLGGTVEYIFEIAMRSNSDDVMHDGLKRNLKDALSKWRTEKFTVNYSGYKGQSVDAILVSLYEMKKYRKLICTLTWLQLQLTCGAPSGKGAVVKRNRSQKHLCAAG